MERARDSSLQKYPIVQRTPRDSFSQPAFKKAGIKIDSTSGTYELDAEAVRIVTNAESSILTSRTVIGTITSAGPSDLRMPVLLSLDNFTFHGGVELSDQLYFFHCLTTPCSFNGLINILSDLDFSILEIKVSSSHPMSQKIILVRGLSKTSAILGKEYFASLNGINMLTGVAFDE
ncbi:uncharacterized protein LOC110854542 isoform X2 [Folsomia candida]|uniref:uncharacterized protein LOC110854542 isoform X2 n=1 Tax=Folsomia candida TaxID=158441 RepID=UPI000B8FE894|nr:uncharacterized protein LOC110854542 isoform X2 [Folsomia candida]